MHNEILRVDISAMALRQCDPCGCTEHRAVNTIHRIRVLLIQTPDSRSTEIVIVY